MPGHFEFWSDAPRRDDAVWPRLPPTVTGKTAVCAPGGH